MSLKLFEVLKSLGLIDVSFFKVSILQHFMAVGMCVRDKFYKSCPLLDDVLAQSIVVAVVRCCCCCQSMILL